MAETFKCPSCSAPLEFEGNMMQKCKFCGSNVIAPSELFHRPVTSDAMDFSELTGRALKIAEIQQEIQRGNKIMAIKIFRETFGTGLKEAKDAVDAMERGESVDISGMKVQVQKPQQFKLSPEGSEAVKKAGYAIGGSILGTSLLVVIVTCVVVAGVFYFAFQKGGSSGSGTPIVAGTPAPAPDAVEILKFGGEGTGAGKFKDNRHVAVGPNGRIYSSDYSSGRIQVFDAAGQFVTQWNTDPKGPLYELVADRKGNLYVADSNGIAIYEGETGREIKKLKGVRAQAMALSLDGKIFASVDRGFLVLDSELNTLLEVKDASERASSNHGFDGMTVDGSNNIYAIDRLNGDICKFNSEGKFLNRFPTGSSSPDGIAIDPKGRIFISRTSAISVFDDSGKLLKTLKAHQAFGLVFNDAGELFVAARPYVVKYKINF